MATESKESRPRSFRIGHRPFAGVSVPASPPVSSPAAVRLSVEPETQTVRRKAKMRVTVHNPSLSSVTVNLSGNDPDQVVSFHFRPENFTVPAGHDGSVSLVARAPGRLRGQVHRQLTLHAHGGPQPLMAWATIVQRPMLPAWLTRGLGMLLILAGAVGLGATGLLEWTKNPALTGYEWRHDLVAQRAFSIDLDAPLTVRGAEIPAEVTSAGAVAAVFGALALLGLVLGKARMVAWVGLGAVLALTAFVLALMREGSDVTPDLGFWLATAAAGAALFGSALARR